jgi:hypothetical protein
MLLRQVCERPAAPTGFEFVTANVSAGGEGLFLFIGDDADGDVRGTTTSPGFATFPKPRMPTPKPFKLAIHRFGALSWIDLPLSDISFPNVELFPDGRILLAASRCAWRSPDDFDRNGMIIDPVRGTTNRILLGDGIQHIGIDALGRIWVGYFDEGVFGNFGWGHPGPSGPGAGGLVCFNDNGGVLWRFNRDDGEAFIDDCYAMNSTRDEIWIFYYSDFRICRMGSDFSQTFYKPKGIEGSHALAVSKDAVLLSGQSREARDTFYLMRRIEDRLTSPRKLRLQLPKDHGRLDDAKVIGQGEDVNVITEAGWFQLSIGELG